MRPLSTTVVLSRADLRAWLAYELSNRRAAADYALRMDAATYVRASYRTRYTHGELTTLNTQTPTHPHLEDQ